MIFTFLISIVFIAELIIAITILLKLRQIKKTVHELNLTISYIQPSIREVCILTRKISAQIVELTERFIENFKQKQEEILLRYAARIILGTLFFRKLKKTKALKLISKGLSLLEIVV